MYDIEPQSAGNRIADTGNKTNDPIQTEPEIRAGQLELRIEKFGEPVDIGAVSSRHI